MGQKDGGPKGLAATKGASPQENYVLKAEEPQNNHREIWPIQNREPL